MGFVFPASILHSREFLESGQLEPWTSRGAITLEISKSIILILQMEEMGVKQMSDLPMIIQLASNKSRDNDLELSDPQPQVHSILPPGPSGRSMRQ